MPDFDLHVLCQEEGMVFMLMLPVKKFRPKETKLFKGTKLLNSVASIRQPTLYP